MTDDNSIECPGALPPEPTDVCGRLEWALGRLQAAQTACTAINVSMALHSIVGSVRQPERQEADPDLVRGIRDALRRLTRIAIDDAAPLAEDNVSAGMAATIELLALFDHGNDEAMDARAFNQFAEYLDYAMLLSAELSALAHRRSIATRRACEIGMSKFKPDAPADAGSLH